MFNLIMKAVFSMACTSFATFVGNVTYDAVKGAGENVKEYCNSKTKEENNERSI